MAEKKRFDLAAALSQVSNLDTVPANEAFLRIPLDQIEENKKNAELGFEIEEVEALADTLKVVGLLQPCSVVPAGNPVKPYRMEAGHRRLAAYRLNQERYPDEAEWREIPCVVHNPNSGVLEELGLILTNTTPRKLNPAQLGELAERVTELLAQYQEESGAVLPGKMRDQVAQLLQVNATKLANLNVIRKNLIPEYMEAFRRKKDPLNLSVALELARLPKEHQALIFASHGEQGLYTAASAKNCGDCLRGLFKLTCDDGGACTNWTAMWAEMSRPDNYRYMPCKHPPSMCCVACSERFRCKATCPKCADEVKDRKAADRAKRKEEIAEEKRAAAEEKESIIALWRRFGEARSAAGVTQQEAYQVLNHYWSDYTAKLVTEYENGTYDFKNTTNHPYLGAKPWQVAALAKLLGCSIDYLFCNADISKQTDLEV